MAHVVVTPATAPPATYQLFTVSVPNEKSVPTTGLTLLIPEAVSSVTPTVKPGWTISTKTEKTNQLTAIHWEGGVIPVGLRDDFTFSAKTPASVTSLHWKAYQTYADGNVVAWDQPSDTAAGDPTKGPFSITTISAASPTSQTDQNTPDISAQTTADRAFYLAIIGVVVGVAAFYVATRSR